MSALLRQYARGHNQWWVITHGCAACRGIMWRGGGLLDAICWHVNLVVKLLKDLLLRQLAELRRVVANEDVLYSCRWSDEPGAAPMVQMARPPSR